MASYQMEELLGWSCEARSVGDRALWISLASRTSTLVDPIGASEVLNAGQLQGIRPVAGGARWDTGSTRVPGALCQGILNEGACVVGEFGHLLLVGLDEPEQPLSLARVLEPDREAQ